MNSHRMSALGDLTLVGQMNIRIAVNSARQTCIAHYGRTDNRLLTEVKASLMEIGTAGVGTGS